MPQATSLTVGYPIQSPINAIQLNFNPHEIILVVTLLIFVIWVLYTFVACYHWLKYGHRSWLAIPMIAAHIVISAFLFLFAIAGFI